MSSCNDKRIEIDEKKVAWNVLKIIGMVILGIGACVLFGFIVMWLWNWLMPMIFGLTEINYWQAVGIFIFAKILFGFGGSSSSDNSENKRKGTIRGEIRKEIKKEFDKEFDKEHNEQAQDGGADNNEYDRMYDKWWQDEGEKSFERFMNNKEEADK